MNSYYTAFDFGQKRVGFAELSQGGGDQCQDDLGIDINYTGPPLPPPVPKPAPPIPTPPASNPAPPATPVIPAAPPPTPSTPYTPPPPQPFAQQRSGSGATGGGGDSDNAKVIGLGLLAAGVALVAYVLNRRSRDYRHRRIEQIVMSNEENLNMEMPEFT